MRLTRLYVDTACRTEIACRLENFASLPVVQRNLFDIVHRKFSQIHLPVLSVSQLDTVVEYSYLICAHTAYVDGFQATYASVVFQLYSGKISDGIGDGKRIKGIQFLSRQFLCRDDFFLLFCCCHHFGERSTLDTVFLVLCRQ